MEQLHGLKQSEVTESREKYGSNVIPDSEPTTFWKEFRETFQDPMIRILVAIALLIVVTLASRLLLRPGAQASALLRRVASRRRGRCELSLVSAMITLLHQEPGLYDHLVPRLKLKLDGNLANVS